MSRACPQIVRVAQILGADPVVLDDDPDKPSWRFWGFDLHLYDGGYCFSPEKGPFPLTAGGRRYTVEGVADEIRRRQVALPGFGQKSAWRLRAGVDLAGGWAKNARVWLSADAWGRRTDPWPWIAVSMNDDPAGWPVALGALYHRRLEPLIDHLLESSLYEADHERLAAAWRDSREAPADPAGDVF
jgi:hypothetical protein